LTYSLRETSERSNSNQYNDELSSSSDSDEDYYGPPIELYNVSRSLEESKFRIMQT